MSRHPWPKALLLCSVALLSSCQKEPSKIANEVAPAVDSDTAEVTLENARTTYGFAAHVPQSHALTVGRISTTETQIPQPSSDLLSIKELLANSSWTFSSGKNLSEQVGHTAKLFSEMRTLKLKIKFQTLFSTLLDTETPPTLAQEFATFLTSRQGQQQLDSIEIVPTFLALKIEDDALRAGWVSEFHTLLTKGSQSLGIEATPVATPVANGIFKGIHLNGESLLNTGEILNQLGHLSAKRAEALRAALSKKEIVFLVGEVDDHLLLFVGKSAAELQLAKLVEQSILAKPHAKFLHNHSSSNVLGYCQADQELCSALKAHMTVASDFAAGISTALNETPNLPANNTLERHLDRLADRERNLVEMHQAFPFAAVITQDKGWKVAMKGGLKLPYFDLTTPYQSTVLTNSEKQLFLANYLCDAEGIYHLIDTAESVAQSMSLLTSSLENSLDTPAEKSDNDASLAASWKAFREKFVPSLSGRITIESLLTSNDQTTLSFIAGTHNAPLLQQGLTESFPFFQKVVDITLLRAQEPLDFKMQPQGNLITWNSQSKPISLALSSDSFIATSTSNDIPATLDRLKPSIETSGASFQLNMKAIIPLLTDTFSLPSNHPLMQCSQLKLTITEENNVPKTLLYLKE